MKTRLDVKPAAEPTRKPSVRFGQLLAAKAPRLPSPKGRAAPSAPQAVGPRAMPLPSVGPASARLHADREAQRLTSVRADHHATAQQLDDARSDVAEPSTPLERALVKHLEVALSPPTPAPPVGAPTAQRSEHQSALAPAHPSRAHEALQLIEAIEVLVKRQRPAMRIGLQQSLGAEVEIERVGPKAVAVRLSKTTSPLPPERLEALKRALRARGLTVARFSVG